MSKSRVAAIADYQQGSCNQSDKLLQVLSPRSASPASLTELVSLISDHQLASLCVHTRTASAQQHLTKLFVFRQLAV